MESPRPPHLPLLRASCPTTGQTPLPLIAVISFNTGVMSILMGFLAELLMRTYFESQHKAPYAIRGVQNLAAES